MTDTTPEPIRKSSLPCIPPTEEEFFTWFPHPDGGGDMVRGQRQRGVQVRRRVSYGDWEPVQPDRWADEPTGDARLADTSIAQPPADRAAVLDDEAALIERHCPNHSPQDQDGVWMDCHCAVADDMRKRAAELCRLADEAQPGTEAAEVETPQPVPASPAPTALRIRVLREILGRLEGRGDGDSVAEEVGAATVRAVLAEILGDMQQPAAVAQQDGAGS